jgi:hypothetical protein
MVDGGYHPARFIICRVGVRWYIRQSCMIIIVDIFDHPFYQRYCSCLGTSSSCICTCNSSSSSHTYVFCPFHNLQLCWQQVLPLSPIASTTLLFWIAYQKFERYFNWILQHQHQLNHQYHQCQYNSNWNFHC